MTTRASHVMYRGSPWTAGAALVAALVVTPLVAVAANLVPFRADVWSHLAATILPAVVRDTFVVVGGVAVLSGVLGTALAWLVAVHEFPGRRLFDWALVLPLAVPAYVLAFVYLALFDFTGPFQTTLRELLGPDVRLPDVRSMGGLVVMMSLALYPYPYLLARSAFADLGATPVEAARALGLSARQAFWRIALPLARPAVAGGVALASMEALADFGTVSLFDVRTFTVAIYRVWFGMFDRQGAGQLAALLLLVAVALLLVERLLRRRARYVQAHGRGARVVLSRLGPWQAGLATLACSALLAIAVVAPVGVLVAWSHESGWTIPAGNYASLVSRSLVLSLAAAALTLGGALLIACGRRLYGTRPMRALSHVAGLGYALPGSVIAVGVLLVISPIDHLVTSWLETALGQPLGLILSGSALALLFAYLVRFLAVALSPVDAGLEQIAPTLDESARSLGSGVGTLVRSVHLPLLRGALITAFLLVSVDVLKELPATMLIRPFGWDTLAIEVWQRTTESLWHAAALPALTIVAAGMLPVIMLTRLRRDRRESATASPGVPVAVLDAGIAAARGDERAVGPLLALERVTRRYPAQPTPAVADLSLAIEPGEIVALLGPSGCGKTTTLRLIAGFDAPERGRVAIDGRVVTDGPRLVPPERRRVGVVFQEGALFPHLTIRRNIAFGLSRLPRQARRARVAEVLALCALEPFADRHPHELSGGQQQRAALARALAPAYPIVLLDEPFSNTDPTLRMTLRRDVCRILRQAGVTAIVVTHDREDAFDVADRVAVMRAGRLEQIGTAAEVFERPATAFVARFVGDAAPLPAEQRGDGLVTELGALPRPAGADAGDGPVDVLLRPDQLVVHPAASGPGRVVQICFRGDHSHVTVRLASGVELTGTAAPGDGLAVDQPAALRVVDGPLAVFPADR